MPDWLKSFSNAWDWSMMYLFPLIASAIFFGLGARQLARMRWLVLGAVLTAILAAAVNCGTIFSELPGKSALSVGLYLNSDEASARLAASLVPVCIMSVLYWLWQRRKSAAMG